MKGNDFKQVMETYFPTSSAYDWDNVGLQIGTLNREISGVLISLDLTMEVIEEAISNNCNLILVHHPMIFRALKTIATDSYLGRMIATLIKNDITLYVAHTNFDVAPFGMNQLLAEKLRLSNLEPLEEISDTESLGIIGTLENVMTFDELVDHVKMAFQLAKIQVIQGSTKKYHRIGITGGSGSTAIQTAMRKDVDAFISGDITYHHALDAKNVGFTILDVGHNIEKHALFGLKLFLEKHLSNVQLLVSKVDTNPYQIK